MTNSSILAEEFSPQGYRLRTSTDCSRSKPSSCRVIHHGEHLIHAGERDHDIYLIRSGNLKSYTIYADGEEQIVGLHGAGDVVGFDAVFGTQSLCSVVAVATAHVQVLELSRNVMPQTPDDGYLPLVFQAVYQELMRATRLLHMERHPTDRRLAEFLLDYSDRQHRRGMCPDRLMLPVSRRDLARYLGLAPETLSRTFSALQAGGLVELDNREVIITDRPKLEALACP